MQVSVIKPNKIGDFFDTINAGIKDNVPMGVVAKWWRDYSTIASYYGDPNGSTRDSLNILEAVMEDGSVVECDHAHTIDEVNGAYPSPAVTTRKGTKELPNGWKTIRLVQIGGNTSVSSIIARRNNDGTCTTFPMSEDVWW